MRLLTEVNFDRTTFLAAVDRKTKAPEVQIPGVAGLRGALSYAVARAIEGSAAIDGDGKTTVKELFGNVRQVVYQLSNERQNIVTTAAAGTDPNTEVVFQLVRSAGAEPLRQARAPVTSASAAVPTDARPLKIAALDGNATHFSGIKGQQASFKIVAPVEHPDLTWDPASHDVLAWGDIIAYGVEPNDLPSVIDRAVAIRDLKLMANNAPQAIKVAPDDSLHRDFEPCAHRDTGRCQSSDGLVEHSWRRNGGIALSGRIRPIHSAQSRITASQLRVRKPYGSDQLIVITSQQRMTVDRTGGSGAR